LVVERTAAGCGLQTVVIDPSCGEKSVTTLVPVLKVIVPCPRAIHGPIVEGFGGTWTVTDGLFLGCNLIGPNENGDLATLTIEVRASVAVTSNFVIFPEKLRTPARYALSKTEPGIENVASKLVMLTLDPAPETEEGVFPATVADVVTLPASCAVQR
jgi:hypothetical protein